MELPVIKVDSAVSATEMKIYGDMIDLSVSNAEYKYLSAFPICEDGSYIPMCSKDLHNWSICFGATLDGDVIDVRAFAKSVEVAHETQNT